jgi:hypothetical protein
MKGFNLNKYTAFKAVTGLVTGLGVSRITGTIITNLVPTETTTQKVLVAMGKMGIGMTASAIVCKHVDEQIDEYRDMFVKTVGKVEEKQAQQNQ